MSIFQVFLKYVTMPVEGIGSSFWKQIFWEDGLIVDCHQVPGRRVGGKEFTGFSVNINRFQIQ